MAQEETVQMLRGTVDPGLPLTLLETVRARDLPVEVLENEDIVASLPRRLGLSEVVSRQIKRYQEAQRRGERVDMQEVADLLRLVLRRPDAEELLRDTGRELAREYVRRASAATRRLVPRLPKRVAFLAVRGAARRLLRTLAGPAEVHTGGRPLVARITGAITSLTDSTGLACVLYAGALEELGALLVRSPLEVRHTRCATRGDPVCEWLLAETTT